MGNEQWLVYLVRCSDDSLYCGITNNIEKRLEVHNSGKGAKHTRSRRPIKLVGISSEMSKSDALKLEYRVKQATPNEKISELLEGGNLMARNLEKDLMAFNREIKVLSKKLEKIAIAVGKLEQAKPVKKTKAVTKAPARKKSIKAKPTAKKVTSKKVQKMTATDTVLGLIQKYKRGRDTEKLMAQTGFDQKKIANIIYTLKKQGKIKIPKKGVYMKA